MSDTAKDGTNRGGARPGAGRKKKSLDEKITEGKTPKILKLPAPSKIKGVDVPPPGEYLAAQENYKKKTEGNEAVALYHKYYKRYAARVKVRQIKESDFKKWKYEAIVKRDECSAGKITSTEFTEWLERCFPNRKKK